MTERAETLDLEPCPVCGAAPAADARFCASCGARRAAPSEVPDPPDDSVADPLVGRVIADRYRIVGLLGRGGMGVVYKVEHVHIGKLMAMKLLHGELARDRDTIKRFRREAEAASRLSHPNTVQIFDFGRDQGLMYLVMEYIEGRDFGWVIQHEGPLSFARVARICAQVCASVGEAHESGIIHRDLKPENVMVVEGRERPDPVKVLDFGLAKLRQEDAGHTLTRAGSIIGTPYYMAPEHIRGEDVDARSDVYSLGAVMYKAVAGVPPFWASSPMGVLTKHLTDEVVPPSQRSSRRDLPPEADAIILHAMQKDAADRYQSMAELRSDLAAYLASIGEELADSGLSHPGVVSVVATQSGRNKAVQVATRSDVDHYERRIKRRGWVGVLVALALLGGGGAGASWWATRPTEVVIADSEVEPNDVPDRANVLRPGEPLRGRLGRRIHARLGDQDIYRIDNPGGGRRAIRFEVTALPNIDLAVDVVKAGLDSPLLVADSGGRREGEAAPNFPLAGSVYFLRVREVRLSGEPPTENVSDHYTVSWDFVPARDGDEQEINDSLELAEPVEPGAAVRGFVGWGGDIDTFCLASDAPTVSARVSGVAGVDLVLRVVDRAARSSRKIDAAGVGAGEEAPPVVQARRGDTCFEVSADALQPGAARASATSPYRLELRVGPGGGGGPTPPAASP